MNRDLKIISETYKKFVQQQPCICRQNCGDVVAHHVRARGRNEGSRNDFLAVPLGVRCHHEIHKVGAEKYAATMGVDIWQEAVWLLIEFFVIGGHSVNPLDSSYCRVDFGKSALPRRGNL